MTVRPSILLFCLLCFLKVCLPSGAQVCTPDHFFKRYQGNSAVYNYKTITTPASDVLCGGATLKLNGEFPDATDGWITKLSPRGTILWSKRYFIPGFNSGGFLSIENATDSTYLVTGRFGKYKRNLNGSLQELDAASYLIYLDKFGNIIWVKRITNYINDSYLSTITRLSDNSFLISGNVINTAGAKLLLLKTDLSGNVAWHKLMFVDSCQTGTAAVKELSNGELLLSGMTYKPAPDYSYIADQGYYFIKLDAQTGSVTRSSAIYFTRNKEPRFYSFENTKKILQIANDTLVLAASFSGHQSFIAEPGVKQALVIKTGINGQFYQADAYYNTQPGCQLLDIHFTGNQYHALVDDGYKSLYMGLDRSGGVLTQRSYGNAFSLLKAYKFLDNGQGKILYSGRRQYALLGFMKTEDDGSIPCMETGPQLVREPVSSLFTTGLLQMTYITTSFPFAFEDMGRSMGWSAYTFAVTTDCSASCCDNIRSDTSHTELCNAPQYRLPDNSIIKETGLYYTQHRTNLNCDSTAYYDIIFSKNPIVNLGEDTCLNTGTTVVLRTDSGYLNYNWMGAISGSHTFGVSAPGVYSVSVTNQCGTASDEIEVFRDCNFPVYIPSAFTPNNDGLNDNFGYPLMNKNRFISLSIYNRYGQQIFFSTDKSKRWDGRYKEALQPADLFVYYIRLLTLDGKPVTQKGTVQLIR